MRELTLFETSYMAGILVLSLVLPLLMSFRSPRDVAARKLCMRIVWIGQACGAVASLAVLASASVAPWGALFGLLSCIYCAFALVRQGRGTCPGAQVCL